MCGGERPIGAAKGKQSDTEALCQPPPPFQTPPSPPPVGTPPYAGPGLDRQRPANRRFPGTPRR